MEQHALITSWAYLIQREAGDPFGGGPIPEEFTAKGWSRDPVTGQMVKRRSYRMNGKCKSCGHKQTLKADLVKPWSGDDFFRKDGEETPLRTLSSDSAKLDCPNGHSMVVKAVHGTYNAGVKCDARCTGATGNSCDCSCGGANHGAGN